MTTKESTLRDHLKQHLEMIEVGLQLVDDEFYLKNKFGTSGFIDILAKDSGGHLVVIEIKVSKHSEREAITELFKYLALLKQNMSLKDSEIKLVIISTDWRELLTPFAEFCWNTNYNSSGLLAKIDDDGFPLKLNSIEIPNRSIGRILVPRHWLQVYQDKADRDKRAIEYSNRIHARGIHNFIVLLFYFDYIGDRQYGFYFAQQQEDLGFYKEILRSVLKERFEEILEYTGELSNPDHILHEFADAAIDMISVPADEKEIGCPEKIKGYLEEEMWTIEMINRFGTFARDIRLTDEQIIDDLCGYTGGSHTWYFAVCQHRNKAHIQEIVDSYSACLYYNDIWRRAIRDYIEYFKLKDEDSNLLISIFNTENILETIALGEKYELHSYIPYFTLAIESPSADDVEIFEGFLAISDSVRIDLSVIVAQHFQGHASNIPMYAHLHGIAPINGNIMSDLGLGYSIRYRKVHLGDNVVKGTDPAVRGRTISLLNRSSQDDFAIWMMRNDKAVASVRDIYDTFTVDGRY
jgi:hypothetical protein